MKNLYCCLSFIILIFICGTKSNLLDSNEAHHGSDHEHVHHVHHKISSPFVDKKDFHSHSDLNSQLRRSKSKHSHLRESRDDLRSQSKKPDKKVKNHGSVQQSNGRVSKKKLLLSIRPFQFRIPRTNFSCLDRAPGYYADMEANCTVYHICKKRVGIMSHAFLCPTKTLFNQRTLVCDHEAHVDCSKSGKYFHKNLILKGKSKMADIRKKLKERRQKLQLKMKILKQKKSQNIFLTPSPITNVTIRDHRPNAKKVSVIENMGNGRVSFTPLFLNKHDTSVRKTFEKLMSTTAVKGQQVDPNEQLELLGLPFNSSLSNPTADEDRRNQLISESEASNSVVKLHQDPESIQLIGHLLSPDDLTHLIPPSPTVNINFVMDGRIELQKDRSHDDQSLIPDRVKDNRVRTAKINRQQHSMGFPVGLQSQEKKPLIWVAPATFARSPMVHIKSLKTSAGLEEDMKNFQRTLTMMFPGKRKLKIKKERKRQKRNRDRLKNIEY